MSYFAILFKISLIVIFPVYRTINETIKVVTISAIILQPYSAYLNTTVHTNGTLQNTVKNTFNDNSQIIQQSAPGNYTINILVPEVKLIPIITDRM